MRRLDLRILAALGAALLLSGAAVWPAVTLASPPGGASAPVDQAIGYGYPTTGGLPWSGNTYPGSGLAAWSGARYPIAAPGGWWSSGYPASGYSWPTASGSSYPIASGGSYLYYPAHLNYGWYYAPNGGYSIAPALSGVGGVGVGSSGSVPYAYTGNGGTTAYLLCTSPQGGQVLVASGSLTTGYSSCTPYAQ